MTPVRFVPVLPFLVWFFKVARNRSYDLSKQAKRVSSFVRCYMRPLSRGHVNKGGSARQFRKNVSRTKAANMAGAPMRGGIRL